MNNRGGGRKHSPHGFGEEEKLNFINRPFVGHDDINEFISGIRRDLGYDLLFKANGHFLGGHGKP